MELGQLSGPFEAGGRQPLASRILIAVKREKLEVQGSRGNESQRSGHARCGDA